TNRSLIDLAQNNILREDIYFRLAVFPIDIPPLRERKDDIPLLAKVFLEQLNDENGTAFSWTNEQLKELQTYDWPGNVRELRHAIHRAFIMSDPQTSDVALPNNLESPFSRVNNQAQENQVSAGQTIEEVEKELIHATLDKVQGNKTLAAQMLGISTKTLYNRLNAYGGIGEYK
ncbi:MAG: helix-turn-helix domain-containing protein, partial [Pseudoalteromonas tetraodonis]|nr:helix-turn-helix domain-containing protein [Pseudoalteromonas tetraodonis]